MDDFSFEWRPVIHSATRTDRVAQPCYPPAHNLSYASHNSAHGIVEIMRNEWKAAHQNDKIKTQLHYARQGLTTGEMEFVAKREQIPAERSGRKLPVGA